MTINFPTNNLRDGDTYTSPDMPGTTYVYNSSIGSWVVVNNTPPGSPSPLADGFTGSRGSLGFVGSRGFTGSASTAVGYAGSRGFVGSRGDRGYTGSASTAAGFAGSRGFLGSRGDRGYTGSASALALTIRDEGTSLSTSVNNINFIGNGVTVSSVPNTPSSLNVTIPGTTNLIVKDEGTAVNSQVSNINFVGAGVTVTNASSTEVTVTISGGGGSSSTFTGRISSQESTASLANNASGNIYIIGFQSYGLYKVYSSHAAWIRIYTTDAARTADASRTRGTDPTPDAGVVAEVITTTADQTVKIAPAVLGYLDNNRANNNIPVTVTNLSGATRQISVTFTVAQLEKD